MGVVFEATHRDLERPVALKVLLAEMLDVDAFRHRFIREARALAAVDSPYIVPVFDAGEQDGWLFIATKLFADGDLGEWIGRHGALSQADAISVMAQVAEGLADAHEAGFLHRDIKPSNVLMQRRPTGLRAVICDFGIAFAEGNEHTKTVGVIGTLGYMAPERHEGEPATAASDIYSLGCVLYACLTGRAPWVGTDVKVAMGHLYDPVPQLPEATDAMNRVLARALAKDPAERFATAADFKAALLELEVGAGATTPVAGPDAEPPTQFSEEPAAEPVNEPVPEPVGPEAQDLPPMTVVSVLGSLKIAGAESEPEQADDTILVNAVVVEDLTVVPAPPEDRPLPKVEESDKDNKTDKCSKDSKAASRRTRRPWWIAAAALVLIAGVAIVAILVGQNGEGRTLSAAPESAEPSPATTYAATPSSTPSIAARMEAPDVTARPGNMYVNFLYSFPSSISLPAFVEYSSAESGALWKSPSSRIPGAINIGTEEGGQRVCIRVRVEAGLGFKAGPSVRVCGSSKPKTLSLKLAGECTPAEAGCSRVTMVATGLPRGRAVTAKIFEDGELYTEGCTFADGTEAPCLSGEPDSEGKYVQSVRWYRSVLMTVELAGLKASVQIP